MKFEKLNELEAKLAKDENGLDAAFRQHAEIAQGQARMKQELAFLRQARAKDELRGNLGGQVDEKAAAERDARIAELSQLTAEGALEAAAEVVEEQRKQALSTWQDVSAEFGPLREELLAQYEKRLREMAPKIAQIKANIAALRTNPSGIEADFRLPSALGHGDLIRALATPKPTVPQELQAAIDFWLRAERKLNRPLV